MSNDFVQKRLLIVVFGLLCILLSTKATINILPLGNSITYDFITGDTRPIGEKISYRFRLYELLKDAGYNFDYVGSEQSGGNLLPPGYTDNGGFPGINNKEMLDKLKEGYLDDLNPDIILLEIGTNDLTNNTVADEFAGYLNNILDEIDKFERNAKKKVIVILAKIINRSGPNSSGNHPTTTYYNEKVEQIKNSRSGDDIILVDMENDAGIDYRLTSDGGDMVDIYHPAQSGYIKMANVWFAALDSYLSGPGNEPPVLSGIENTDLRYEGSGNLKITNSITVNDDNHIILKSAQIRISNSYNGGQDVISFTNTSQITGLWDEETGILSLSGNATLANYQAALRSIEFKKTGSTPQTPGTRTISFIVSDGTENSEAVSRSIVVSAENQPPVLSNLETEAISYPEGTGKVRVTAAITPSDPDNNNLSSATVSIGNYINGQDVLTFTNSTGITGVWNAANGTVTFSGEANLTNYQTVLRSIEYENLNKTNPTAGNRTISFIVNDGTENSEAVSRNIVVSAENQPPVLTNLETEAISYPEGTGKVRVTAAITPSDPDNDNLNSATVSIGNYVNGQDVLTFTNATGITGVWSAANGTVTFSGVANLNNYQTALRSIEYENLNKTNPTAGTRTISFIVSDGTENSEAVSRSIVVLSENQPPVLSNLEAQAINYPEGSGKIHVTAAITPSDPDNNNLNSATVSIGNYVNGQDVLTFTNDTGITGVWSAANGTVTFTGEANLNNYQTVLRSIEYENLNKTNPTAGTRTISFIVSDGTENSEAVSRNIVVSSENQPPVLSNLETEAISYPEGTGKVRVTAAITPSDPDNDNLNSATVSIGNYVNGQDVLTFTNATGITGVWSAANGTVTFSGETALENYQTVLRSIEYENLNKTKPTAGTRTISFIVSDGTENSEAVSRNIVVSSENQPPVLSNMETEAINYPEGTGKVRVTAAITPNDNDDANLNSATVSIGGYVNGQDVLTFTNATGITGVWSAANGTVTFSGVANLNNYQAALRSIEYENLNKTNPTAGTRTISFIVSDGTENSEAVSRNIVVSSENQPPVLSNLETEAISYPEGTGKVRVTAAITPNDNDDANLNSATVSIGGYVNGQDILTFTNATGITGVWSAANGTVTFSGVANLNNYQAALRSIEYENLNKTNPTAGTRTISFIVSDGTENSEAVSRSIVVLSENQPPVLSNLETEAIIYPEGTGKVRVTAAITPNDNDDANLNSATVSIGNYVNGQDVLTFTNANGITGVWSAANGTVTFSGVANLNNYQAVLRSIEYENLNKTNPTAGTRTISFIVSDGTENSEAVSRSIVVSEENQPPVLSNLETEAISYPEGTGKVLVTAAITPSDPDNDNLNSATVSIGNYVNGQDVLTFTNATGITGVWSAANGTVTFSGVANLNNYQTVLRSIEYENLNKTNPTAGTRTISFIVNDGTENSEAVSRGIVVSSENQPPVLSNLETEAISYPEGTGKVLVTAAITPSDPDNDNLNSATVSIGNYVNGQDVLTFTNATGITGVWSASNGTVTFTGVANLNNYQTVLRSIEYENLNKTNPTAGTRTISFIVSDGTENSEAVSRSIVVSSENQPPVLSNLETEAISYPEGTGKVLVTAAITPSDPDNNNLNSATVSIGNYVNGQDVLTFTNATGITGVWNAANGTLTLSGDATLANYQTALRSIQYENTNITNPTAGTRTISFVVNDGALNSTQVNRSIEITLVNNAPVLSNIETAALSYTEGSGKKPVTAQITITDPDNVNIHSASVTISAGYINGQDVLSFVNANGITGAWNAAIGTLTLSGDATLANYQAALRSIQYENTNTTNPTAGTRTISFVVNDGALNSTQVNRSIEIVLVNQPPVLANIETTALSYAEGSGKKPVTAQITITDPDNVNIHSASITISAGYVNGQDVLSFVNTTGITGVWNAANGTLTLSGDATLANYQTALRSIQYENTNTTNPTTGTRTISFVVNDGALNSTQVNRSIEITLVNNAPVLSNIETAALSYTEGSGKKPVSSAITTADPDNVNIHSATVTISAGYVNGQDVLSFVNANGITGAWNAATGTLTLSGDATLANYQAALRSIQYENTNTTNPTAGTRTISFVVNDGALNSTQVNRSIEIVLVNQPPVLANIETTALSYTEGSGKKPVTAQITITDPDNVNLHSATVAISAGYVNGQDVLSFINANGITGAWNAATGTLTLSGDATLVNYQAALRSIQYENTNATNPTAGTRTISFIVNDGALNSTQVNRSIEITLVNNAPVLSNIETAALSYTEGSGKKPVSSAITTTDPDNANIHSATVTISAGYINGQDVLSFVNANGITGAWNAATGTLTLSGDATLANYQAALRSIEYENANATNPTTGTRTISFIVNDGALNSNLVNRSIEITLVNNAPVLANIETAALSYTEGSGKISVSSAITTADPDNANIHSATVTISAGYVNGQDVLSFVNANGITGAWNAETRTLTLSGDATLANYQAALRSIEYENTNAANPTAGTRTISFIVNDGALNSNLVNRSIEITLVNNAPVLANIETAALSYTEGSGKISVSSAITTADPDNANIHSATVTISAGYINGQDVLSFDNANGITGAWNAETGTLTLSGDATLANYQSALRSIQYENTNATNPSTDTRTISFVINDGALNSNLVNRNIEITLVNNAPVLSNIETTALSYTEGSGKISVSSAITITDPDNANILSATVTISTGYVNGQDVLSFVNANGITGAWNAESGTITLTGEASIDNYIAALRSIQYENINTVNLTPGARTITFIVNDGELSSTGITRNINVIHINKAPILSNLETSNITYNIPSDPVNLTSAITISDIDDSILESASIQITEGYVSNEDVLSFTSSDNISATWNSETGTLALNGSSSLSNYQKAIRNIKYVNLNNNNPSLISRVLAFSVSDGESNSENLERTISFNAPPSATNTSIDGIMSVCKTLTGKYTYADNENDAENHTTFRWLRANTVDGERTPIPEATSITYTLTLADQNKFIFFEVTPQAKTGSIQGRSIISSPTTLISNNLPTAALSGTATICEGTIADITVTFTGKPPFRFTYTDGLTNSEITTSELIYQIPVSKAGTYKGVKLMDDFGCEVVDLPTTATISTKPSPVAEIVDLNSAYSLRGVPVALKGTPAGGVFHGKGVVAANNTFNPSLAGVEGSPHPIVYTYVNPASGCFDTDTVMVEIIDADATISGLRPQYQYCNVDIPTVITGVNVAGTTGNFTISGGKGLTDHKNNTATLNTAGLLPGSYTISYSYSQNGIPQTIYQDININRVDNVIISGFNSAEYCSGLSPMPLSSNYQLGIFEGAGIENNNGVYSFNPKKADLGLNEIIFRYKNSFGCVITDTLNINILATTKPSFEIGSGCWNNAATTFINTTTQSESVKNWKWMFGDSSVDNQSALKDPTHLYAASGDYAVKLITTNLNNCTDTISQIVHLGKMPVANFEWDKECITRNEALHINNTTSSEEEIDSFRWIIQDALGNVQSFNTEEVTYNFKRNEKYTVKLNLITTAGCKDSVIKALFLGAPHSLKDSSYSESFENKESWNIENLSSNNWKWQLPAGSITTAHSGSNAFSTQFTSAKGSQQLVVSSPCFDFTGIERPYIELWINSSIVNNEEGAVMQYKSATSDSWITVGNVGTGISWYNSDAIVSAPAGTRTGWTGNTNGWIKSVNALDSVANKKDIKFRMIYKTSPGANTANMFAFDDVSIGVRQRTSLFENFTNLSVTSAISYIQQLNEVISKTQKDLVSLEYHASFPGADSLNANNTADPGARILHYGVGLIPYGLLNGGTNSNLIYDFISKKPSTNDIIAQSLSEAPYLLSITTEQESEYINGKVLITPKGNFSNQLLSLYIVVVEDITVQSGSSTMTLYNVVKKFLPSAGGTSLKTSWTQGELVEIPFKWNFVKVYDPKKVKIVAFIQSNVTKEVLQAASDKVSLVTAGPPILEGLPDIEDVVVAPNPATDFARIIFPQSLKKEVTMEIMNMNGKIIKVDKILKDVDVYEFNTSDLSNGLYLIRLSEKTGIIKTLKLIISR